MIEYLYRDSIPATIIFLLFFAHNSLVNGSKTAAIGSMKFLKALAVGSATLYKATAFKSVKYVSITISVEPNIVTPTLIDIICMPYLDRLFISFLSKENFDLRKSGKTFLTRITLKITVIMAEAMTYA